MITTTRHRAVTLTELLVVVLVIGILIALMLPAIQSAREAARRASCVDDLKQLGLGCHNYLDAQKKFPAAGDYDVGTGKWGWSWLAKLLPYIDQANLWNQLNSSDSANADPTTLGGTGQTIANVTSIGAYLCPSYRGPRFANPGGAIANYKTLGATSKASLAVGDPASPATPPYGSAKEHPDGTLFYARQLGLADIPDGTSNTVIVCETVEEGSTACWYLGRYAALVGLPATMQPPGGRLGDYAYPAGFTPDKYAEASTVTATTYLTADFAKTPYDAAAKITYGPSSMHPEVVNHLFADGGVRSVSRDVDPALYAFIITRRAGDPGSQFFSYYSK